MSLNGRKKSQKILCLIGLGVMCVSPGASAYQALYDDEDGLLESFAGYWRVSNQTAVVVLGASRLHYPFKPFCQSKVHVEAVV